MEKWLVQAKKADFYGLGEKFSISPIIARIIRNRNIVTEEEYEEYLSCDMKKLYSPLLMKDMDKAVVIIEQAIRQKKKIRVIGDYDIDGVTSGYILTDGLEALGAKVDFDVPDRILDGYGLNRRLITQAHDDGVQLIVTCDNGIAAEKEVLYANELGMQVVVTDHHEVPYELAGEEKKYKIPAAAAVVDHKRHDCGYPFKHLCGAGVAYKLLEVLYDRFAALYLQDHGNEQNEKCKQGELNVQGELNAQDEQNIQSELNAQTRIFAEGRDRFLEKYLCFAAIGTVGDIVPLISENRTIVKNGLGKIRCIDNPGLQALIEVTGLGEKTINSTHIAFIIGPCINAGGRLDTAKRAFSLFRCRDRAQARKQAEQLKALNDERKDMTVKNTERIIAMLEQDPERQKDKVLVVYLPDCHESLAGIIAGRLREKYYKPSLVFTDCEGGIKGSGRSVEGYSMYEELTLANQRFKESDGLNGPLMTKFGGHKMAAGISMEKEKLDKLRHLLNASENITEDMLVEKIWIDVALPFEYITESLIQQLSLLEPFGTANEKPVFAEKCIAIDKIQIRGQNRDVVALTVRNKSNFRMEATYFADGDRFIQEIRERFGDAETERLLTGKPNHVGINILYYPVVDVYYGKRNIKVVVKGYLWCNT